MRRNCSEYSINGKIVQKYKNQSQIEGRMPKSIAKISVYVRACIGAPDTTVLS